MKTIGSLRKEVAVDRYPEISVEFEGRILDELSKSSSARG
jgi:hypothetical protein